MRPVLYAEYMLVQQITTECLEQQLGWDSVYAYNNEDFGMDTGRQGKDLA
jgi:type I restriction enzyme R subunit